MTTDDHIAAIKEHLKAIEAEKQPKKEPKRYLVIPIKSDDIEESISDVYFISHVANISKASALTRFILSGKIITINEEQP